VCAHRQVVSAYEVCRSGPWGSLIDQLIQFFKRGMNAHNNPGFYRQLGKDPEQLTQAALELLAKKLKL
jgi:hypothetical protein